MKNKILFVLCLLVGLLFINGGLNKFFNYMPAPKDMPEDMVKIMTAFMTITWLMPLVATAELIGGVLFIIPKYRALGAIILFPITIGIVLLHSINAPDMLPMALVIFAIILWAIYENRAKYLPMIEK
ncbi:DoxX family protein [Cytophaga aurantiaca]|uniref:DoxX family protein n=1 Tax=Cytophaga aurantiaca TaxID=29530 RepID=UPI0004782C43|nr:DoxX family protein [Cytophaga aurantiaca]